MHTDIRTKISKRFGGLTEKQLHQLITIVARCRNVCAHGERLYSFRIRETIPDMPLHDKLKITKKKGQFVSGKNDLFAVVIALRYLIGNEYLIFDYFFVYDKINSNWGMCLRIHTGRSRRNLTPLLVIFH